MGKPKVLITNSCVPQVAYELLSKDFEVIYIEGSSPSRSDILSKISGIYGLFWSTKEYCDKEILDAAGPQLRIVSLMSVGYDNVDLKELKSRGILLGNTAKVPNKSVANIAVLLTLAATRRMHEGWLEMNKGCWQFSVNWLLGQDITGSTIGIVGLGAIGQEIVKRLKAFEVETFLYTGHRKKPEADALGATFVSFDDLLHQSDIVISACPYNTDTHEMFNAAAFKKMKQNAVFVNISRGKIVDQPALIEALESNTIFAAGLDVMTPEPLPPGHKLYSLPNCVLMPHLGSATINTRTEMASLAAKNILAAFNNKPIPSLVKY